MQKFKQEVLMQYLYGEAPSKVVAAIEEAAISDWELQEEIKTLKRTIKQLDMLALQSPKASTVNAILQYAKSSEKATEEANHI